MLARTSPAERAAWLRALAGALEAPARRRGWWSSPTARRLSASRGSPVSWPDGGAAALRGRRRGGVLAQGDRRPPHCDSTVAGPGAAPLGPVAVFGASNFPFAFGVLGNDTASALAAGCPVVAKAHPAHPHLSVELGRLAAVALREAGAPDCVLGLVAGLQAGTSMVTSEHTAAVAFTGSHRAVSRSGAWPTSVTRSSPSSPRWGRSTLVVTPAGATRLAEVARGFVGSFTLGTGQFCTKPGLLLAPTGSGAAATVGQALAAAAPQGWLLTEAIGRSALAGVDQLVAGAEVARGEV